MPQSSRMMVMFWACCCHSAISVFALACGTQALATRRGRRRAYASFFMWGSPRRWDGEIGVTKCYGDVRVLGTLSGSKRLRILGPGRCVQPSSQLSHPVSCQRLHGHPFTRNAMRSIRLGWQICALLGVVHAAPLFAQS